MYTFTLINKVSIINMRMRIESHLIYIQYIFRTDEKFPKQTFYKTTIINKLYLQNTVHHLEVHFT